MMGTNKKALPLIVFGLINLHFVLIHVVASSICRLNFLLITLTMRTLGQEPRLSLMPLLILPRDTLYVPFIDYAILNLWRAMAQLVELDTVGQRVAILDLTGLAVLS